MLKATNETSHFDNIIQYTYSIQRNILCDIKLSFKLLVVTVKTL